VTTLLMLMAVQTVNDCDRQNELCCYESEPFMIIRLTIITWNSVPCTHVDILAVWAS